MREGGLIAVLHPYPDGAEKALSRIKAEWDIPPSDLDPKTIYPHLLRVAPEGEVVTEGGDPKKGEGLAKTTFDATYYDHYMAHAPIETHTALAKPEGDRMMVWAMAVTCATPASTEVPSRKKTLMTPMPL